MQKKEANLGNANAQANNSAWLAPRCLVKEPDAPLRCGGAMYFVWAAVFAVPCADVFNLPGDFSIARALTLLAAFVLLVRRGRLRLTPRASVILTLMAAFVVWAVCTAGIVAQDYLRAFRRCGSYIELLVLAWCVLVTCTGEREYRLMLRLMMYGCWILVVGVFWSLATDNPMGDGRYAPTGFGGAGALVFLDPNDTANTIALGVLVAWHSIAKGWGSAITNWLYVASGAAAVVLTGSRSGWVTLAVAMILPLIQLSRARRRGWVVLGVCALICGLAGIGVRDIFEEGRLSTIRSQVEEKDLGGRVDIWRCGTEIILGNPVMGIGAGGFSESVESCAGYSAAAHSVYLEVAAEHGVIGLALFMSVFAVIAWLLRECAVLDRRLGWMMIICLLITAFTLSWENREISWLVLALVGACPAVKASPESLLSRLRAHPQPLASPHVNPEVVQF